jgi:hypothetical protein
VFVPLSVKDERNLVDASASSSSAASAFPWFKAGPSFHAALVAMGAHKATLRKQLQRRPLRVPVDVSACVRAAGVVSAAPVLSTTCCCFVYVTVAALHHAEILA